MIKIEELERRKAILRSYQDSISMKIKSCSKNSKSDSCNELVSRRNLISLEIGKINEAIKKKKLFYPS
jgi:hypothetical protein